jgi:hypothetical protein
MQSVPITTDAGIDAVIIVVGLVNGVQRHFQRWLSCIVVVGFIGGGIRSTQKKTPTYRKSLANCVRNRQVIGLHRLN